MSRIDWTVARTAATGGLIILVPGAFLAALVFDGRSALASWLFLAVVLAGFGVAGYVAGRLRPDSPMLHGAAGALLAFGVAQAFGVATAVARGDRISWIAIPLTALLACSMGVGGGLLSDRAPRRAARPA